MNISHLVVLLVRAFAIFLAFYSISLLIFFYTVTGGIDLFSLINLVFPAILLVIAILAWLLPYSVAQFLSGYKGVMESSDTTPISTEQFTKILLLVLLLYLLFGVIADAGYWFYYFTKHEDYGIEQIALESKANVFSLFVQLLFLIFILLGRKKIVSMILRLRS